MAGDSEMKENWWRQCCRFTLVRIGLGLVIMAAVTVDVQLGFHALSSSSPQLKRFFAARQLLLLTIG